LHRNRLTMTNGDEFAMNLRYMRKSVRNNALF
jgi:hypothetical protein